MASQPRVILLAAGRGSRLATLTDSAPKALVSVLKRPLLSWLLDAIRGAGLADPILVTGYRAEAFDGFGLETIHNPDWASQNMVGSLLKARERLRRERVIVSYTDILYGAADLARFAAVAAPLAVAYDPQWHALWSRRFDTPLEDAETFALDGAGRVIEIGARPTTVEEVDGQYIGLSTFSSDGWRRVEAVLDALPAEAVARMDMTELLRLCIRRHGFIVQGMPLEAGWCEIDVPSDVPIAESVLSTLSATP